MPRCLSLLAAVLVAASPAAAQPAGDYPNRPIRVMVTAPAGGGVDVIARIVMQRMEERLGQAFIFENRGGAGGNLAAELVYKSPPDGYQLLATHLSPITINALLYKSLNFDPTRFEHIGVLSTNSLVLLVKNSFPAKSAKEFVDYVRANPGKVNYASQGTGTTAHMTAELYQKLTGARLVHVPYKGTGPVLNDLVAGHVDIVFLPLESAMRLHETGQARILAVTTGKRLPHLPEIPTMEEAGVKGLTSDTWNALSAPPKTPAPIVARLNAALNQALKEPALVERFKKMMVLPGGGGVAETRAFIQDETRRWGEVIKEAGIPRI